MNMLPKRANSNQEARRSLLKCVCATALAASFGTQAHAADYSFEWIGSDGYRMEGAFRTDDMPDDTGIMTAESIHCFRILGFHNSEPIGAWRLGNLDEDSAWHFNFDPKTSRIMTGGSYLSRNDQQWNSAASYNMCGSGEFGFNAGSGGQELCLNGRLIYDSSVDGDTPLYAKLDETVIFHADDCNGLAIS